MSGHSKFANIKHKKEKNDAAKGKMFTIIGKEIAVAVKEGGADPDNNSKLRDVELRRLQVMLMQLIMNQLHTKDMVLTEQLLSLMR